jgi:hypothetical protein
MQTFCNNLLRQTNVLNAIIETVHRKYQTLDSRNTTRVAIDYKQLLFNLIHIANNTYSVTNLQDCLVISNCIALPPFFLNTLILEIQEQLRYFKEEENRNILSFLAVIYHTAQLQEAIQNILTSYCK